MSQLEKKMYLICGLGNPGSDYENTRHNIGFSILDALASQLESRFSFKQRLKSEVSLVNTQEKEVVLCKPQTFMNLSGEGLKKTMQFYKIPLKNCLVIYDDIDIPFKQFRYRTKGSAGTHNGLKSIIDTLNTNAIPRLRVGIGAPPNYYPLDRYVLSPFSQTEKKALDSIVIEATKTVDLFLSKSQTTLMNCYTKKID